MATPADLASAMQVMDVEGTPTSVHLVKLAYPDTGILPVSIDPELPPPANHLYREKPRLKASQLDSKNLDFFCRFTVPATTSTIQPLTPSVGTTHKDVLTAVERLQAAQGKSSLRVVTYLGSDHLLRCRFQLGTEFHLSAGLSYERHDFELDWPETTALLRLSAGYSWIALLNDLISRASDRAYFAVKARMSDYNSEQWNSVAASSATELLQKNSQVAIVTPNGQRYLTSLPEFLAYNPDALSGTLTAVLPCGDELQLPAGAIGALSEDDCLSSKCPFCAEAILSAKDRENLGVYKDQKLRDAYHEDQESWYLDRAIRKCSGHIKIDVDDAAFAEAANKTLKTLRTPASATPAALSFIGFPETKKIKDALGRITGDGVARTPQDLYDGLWNVAKNALEAGIHNNALADSHELPGYEVFLNLWLTRIVNYILQEQHNKLQSVVGDLTEMMEDTTIDYDPTGLDDLEDIEDDIE